MECEGTEGREPGSPENRCRGVCKRLLRLERPLRQGEGSSLCAEAREALRTCVWLRVEYTGSHRMWVPGSAPHPAPCAFLCVSACEFYMRGEPVCICHKERDGPGGARGPVSVLSSVPCPSL